MLTIGTSTESTIESLFIPNSQNTSQGIVVCVYLNDLLLESYDITIKDLGRDYSRFYSFYSDKFLIKGVFDKDSAIKESRFVTRLFMLLQRSPELFDLLFKHLIANNYSGYLVNVFGKAYDTDTFIDYLKYYCKAFDISYLVVDMYFYWFNTVKNRYKPSRELFEHFPSTSVKHHKKFSLCLSLKHLCFPGYSKYFYSLSKLAREDMQDCRKLYNNSMMSLLKDKGMMENTKVYIGGEYQGLYNDDMLYEFFAKILEKSVADYKELSV